MKAHVLTCILVIGSSNQLLQGNGMWSYEPPPGNGKGGGSQTNHAPRQVLGNIAEPEGSASPLSFREKPKWHVGMELLARNRFEHLTTNRFNPVRKLEWLVRETSTKWVEELMASEAERAGADALKLAFREGVVKPLPVGWFFKDMFGGFEERYNLPSPFQSGEGVLGWDGSGRTHAGPKVGIRPFRESPYVYFSYGVELVEGLWQTNLRLYYEKWRVPKAELITTFPLYWGCSLDAGVEFRQRAERDGSFFARGGDQQLSVFVGLSREFLHGNFYIGMSGPTPRASVGCIWSW